MTREGNLIGPRLVDVKGQIIIGHHGVWMQKYIDGVASPAVIGLPSTTTPPKPSAAPSPHLPRSSPARAFLADGRGEG